MRWLHKSGVVTTDITKAAVVFVYDYCYFMRSVSLSTRSRCCIRTVRVLSDTPWASARLHA